MGNLINPVTTRLGFTSYWTSVWTAYDPKKFSYLTFYNFTLFKFINWVCSKNIFSQFKSFYSHAIIQNFNDELHIHLHFLTHLRYRPFELRLLDSVLGVRRNLLEEDKIVAKSHKRSYRFKIRQLVGAPNRLFNLVKKRHFKGSLLHDLRYLKRKKNLQNTIDVEVKINRLVKFRKLDIILRHFFKIYYYFKVKSDKSGFKSLNFLRLVFQFFQKAPFSQTNRFLSEHLIQKLSKYVIAFKFNKNLLDQKHKRMYYPSLSNFQLTYKIWLPYYNQNNKLEKERVKYSRFAFLSYKLQEYIPHFLHSTHAIFHKFNYRSYIVKRRKLKKRYINTKIRNKIFYDNLYRKRYGPNSLIAGFKRWHLSTKHMHYSFKKGNALKIKLKQKLIENYTSKTGFELPSVRRRYTYGKIKSLKSSKANIHKKPVVPFIFNRSRVVNLKQYNLYEIMYYYKEKKYPQFNEKINPRYKKTIVKEKPLYQTINHNTNLKKRVFYKNLFKVDSKLYLKFSLTNDYIFDTVQKNNIFFTKLNQIKLYYENLTNISLNSLRQQSNLKLPSEISNPKRKFSIQHKFKPYSFNSLKRFENLIKINKNKGSNLSFKLNQKIKPKFIFLSKKFRQLPIKPNNFIYDKKLFFLKKKKIKQTKFRGFFACVKTNQIYFNKYARDFKSLNYSINKVHNKKSKFLQQIKNKKSKTNLNLILNHRINRSIKEYVDDYVYDSLKKKYYNINSNKPIKKSRKKNISFLFNNKINTKPILLPSLKRSSLYKNKPFYTNIYPNYLKNNPNKYVENLFTMYKNISANKNEKFINNLVILQSKINSKVLEKNFFTRDSRDEQKEFYKNKPIWFKYLPRSKFSKIAQRYIKFNKKQRRRWLFRRGNITPYWSRFEHDAAHAKLIRLIDFSYFRATLIVYFKVLKKVLKMPYLTIFLIDLNPLNISAAILNRMFSSKMVKNERVLTARRAALNLVKKLRYALRTKHPGNFTKKFFGYRIECSGRFTKKPKTSTVVIKKGRVPLSTLDFHIDFAFEVNILKMGACGVKTWFFFHKGKKKYRNQLITSICLNEKKIK